MTEGGKNEGVSSCYNIKYKVKKWREKGGKIGGTGLLHSEKNLSLILWTGLALFLAKMVDNSNPNSTTFFLTVCQWANCCNLSELQFFHLPDGKMNSTSFFILIIES